MLSFGPLEESGVAPVGKADAIRTKSVGKNRKVGAGRPDRRPRGTGASHVYEQLRQSILGLQVAPGTLLDESELAAKYNLSRSPVREALIRLSAEGLVHTLPNRSPVVAPFDIGAVPSFLDSVELLYRATCRLAAIYRTEEELDSIEAIHEQLDRTRVRGDMTTQIALNRDFHVRIAEIGGNVYMTQWLRMLLDQGQRLMRLGMYFEGEKTPKSAMRPHEDIIAAIRAQDPDAAETAARHDAEFLRDEMLREFSRRQLTTMKLGPPGPVRRA